jgi:transposase-like protein
MTDEAGLVDSKANGGLIQVYSTLAAITSPQIPACPNNCKTGKIYRDGLRYNEDGATTQRWICTCCGLRFSDKALKSEGALTSSRQICALEAKNLTPAAELKTVAGDKKTATHQPVSALTC